MSLLIRIAQTRSGAERLLEARLLSILSQCDYLDTRPEADHAFIGKGPTRGPSRCSIHTS
jgi:nuclear pore complex protein Nup205